MPYFETETPPHSNKIRRPPSKFTFQSLAFELRKPLFELLFDKAEAWESFIWKPVLSMRVCMPAELMGDSSNET
jgi:hypothetical protein